MNAMSEPISIQQLRAIDPPGRSSAEVVALPMTADDRRRVRRVVEAPDGIRFALELPTGTVLTPGTLLYRSSSRTYVVTAALENVLVVTPRDPAEGARVGHLIGNLHRDIEVDGGDVVALADAALAERLRRAGIAFVEERRAFAGRAPAGHAH